jgi:hypothetical protein
MRSIQIIINLFFFSIVSTQIQCAEYLPYQAINAESSLNILNVLTGQQTTPFQPHDIDLNNKINIPDALYPLLIQANMIEYETHKNNDMNYLLKNGKSFASIAERNVIVIHPDACPSHYGFLWAIVPYISNQGFCTMNYTIEKTQITISLFGNLAHENLSIGSFTLTMQIQINHQKIVSGQINFQIATSNDTPNEMPMYLFNIQSTYLQGVQLIDPPETIGDTGNFSHILISGMDENTFSLSWLPTIDNKLIKKGLEYLQISGSKNLAAGHDDHTQYPDLELSFTSSETIYFMGQYDLINQSNINSYNVSISPYILTSPKHFYRLNCNFICNP